MEMTLKVNAHHDSIGVWKCQMRDETGHFSEKVGMSQKLKGVLSISMGLSFQRKQCRVAWLELCGNTCISRSKWQDAFLFRRKASGEGINSPSYGNVWGMEFIFGVSLSSHFHFNECLVFIHSRFFPLPLSLSCNLQRFLDLMRMEDR